MAYRLRALKPFRYGTRQLQAGDEFDVVSATHYNLLPRARPQHVEWIEQEQEQAAPRGRPRGRPRKSAPLEEKTVPQLREIAEEKGVDLPSGYVPKSELVKILDDEINENVDD